MLVCVLSRYLRSYLVKVFKYSFSEGRPATIQSNNSSIGTTILSNLSVSWMYLYAFPHQESRWLSRISTSSTSPFSSSASGSEPFPGSSRVVWLRNSSPDSGPDPSPHTSSSESPGTGGSDPSVSSWDKLCRMGEFKLFLAKRLKYGWPLYLETKYIKALSKFPCPHYHHQKCHAQTFWGKAAWGSLTLWHVGDSHAEMHATSCAQLAQASSTWRLHQQQAEAWKPLPSKVSLWTTHRCTSWRRWGNSPKAP